MADSSFGTGWPQGNPNIVTLVRSDGLRIPVHRELAELTLLLMDATEAMGYDIKPGETWGYANRNISGTSTASNHSWGTADDINAPSNPYASADWHNRNARGTFPFGLRLVTDIPEKVIALWEKYGYRWGGRYSSKPDPMHFEFMGTVADARRLTEAFKNNEGDDVTAEDLEKIRDIVQNNADRVIDQVTDQIDARIRQAAKRDRAVMWKIFGKTKEEIEELEAAFQAATEQENQ
jgi:hypothetical protein